MPQKGSEALIKPFLGTTKKRRNKNLLFFISFNCFRMLGTGRVNKFFLLGFSKIYKKMVINMKLASTMCLLDIVPLEMCLFSMCYSKLVKFKKVVITARLVRI